jgi:hypothetical protein
MLQMFNTDSFIGSIETDIKVIIYHNTWLGILLVSSLVLLFISVVAASLTGFCRGPDILDSFGSLLRDNCHVWDPHYSSIEDSFAQSRRLGNVRSD